MNTTANKALPPERHTFYCPMKDFVVCPSNGHTSNKPNILVFSAFLLFHFLKGKKKALAAILVSARCVHTPSICENKCEKWSWQRDFFKLKYIKAEYI